jgi:hypothetical protein
MRVFRDFEKRLSELDPDLFLSYAPANQRWMILRRVRDIKPFYTVVGGRLQQHNSKPYRHILTIQDPKTGGYAEPVGDLANEIIAWLKKYDTRVRKPQSILEEIDRHNKNLQETKEKEHRDEMLEKTKYYAKLWKETLKGEV